MPSRNITKKSKVETWFARLPLAPRSAEWLVVGVGAGLFFLTLLAAQLTRPYGSDDVAVQVIFQSWSHGLPLWAVVGPDNFVLKVPFYLVEDILLPHNSRLKLFLLVLLFAAGLFAALVAFMRAYIPEKERRASILAAGLTFMPLAWYFGLTALPHPSATFIDISWVTNFFKLNLRNIELGLALLLMIPWARYLGGMYQMESRRERVIAAGLAVITGVFFYNDPYFLFVLGGGVGAAMAVLWFTSRLTLRQLAAAAIYGALALISYKVVGRVVGHYHYISAQFGNFGFAPFTDLKQTFLNAGEAIFKMFNADFWGQSLRSPHTKIFAANAVLVALCVTAVVYAVRQLRRRMDVMRLLLVCTIVANVAIYCFSQAGTDPLQSRYLMLAIVCSLPLLADWLLALSRQRNARRVFCAVLVVAVLCIGLNLFVNLRLIQGALLRPQDAPNGVNYRIIQAARDAHAYKGYADYWDSDINTYLSDRAVVFIPTLCSEGVAGTLVRYNWLYNLPDNQVQSHRTFFLTTRAPFGNSNGYCGDLLDVLGTPTETIPIDTTYTMYVYDTDIGPAIRLQ